MIQLISVKLLQSLKLIEQLSSTSKSLIEIDDQVQVNDSTAIFGGAAISSIDKVY